MRPSFLPHDTAMEAYDLQALAYRRMGGIGPTGVMFRLTEMARKNAAAGIRERHPDYDEATVKLALFRLLFGDELAREVWSDRPLPDP